MKIRIIELDEAEFKALQQGYMYDESHIADMYGLD